MLKIKNVNVEKDFILKTEFINGEIKYCDIKDFLDKGDFKELKNIDLFKQVKNKGLSIEWPNELDLSSDTLYKIGK